MSERLSGEHGLSFYSVQSFFVHLSLVFLALIIGKLSWDKVQDIRNENIQLVQNSVRVDMVAMPELTIKELKTYEEPVSEPAPAEEVVKKEEPPVVADQPEFVEEKKKQDFASMLKNLSQKKVEEKAAKKEKKKAPKLPGQRKAEQARRSKSFGQRKFFPVIRKKNKFYSYLSRRTLFYQL